MSLLKTKERYFKFLIYICLVILINIVGVTLFFRIDLTKDNKYSLSKASQEVVSTLSDPLTIKVFFTKNLPAPHNNTERYLHRSLGSHHYSYQFARAVDRRSGLRHRIYFLQYVPLRF